MPAIILKLITTAMAKKIIIGLAEVLAKRTNTTVDDEVVKVIKEALGA